MQTMIDQALEPKAGYRLQRLEVYNWGTFHGKVWRIEPGGGTALLTGANGSGKSTLVDALLTLLVPGRKRRYNQASGSERRDERNEKTYVRGAYGRTKNEATNRAEEQYLRKVDSYSTLLATFCNQARQQYLTLAQVFYWRDTSELKRMYIVAPRELSITEHVHIAQHPEELRRRLKGLDAEIFDDFNRYSQRFVKEFQLRSLNALELFNQTVSIKEIGGLNDFVRNHMIERNPVEKEISELRENYQNLTRAHAAIVKAEAQLTALTPLLAEADKYEAQLKRIEENTAAQRLIPAFFAQYALKLGQEHLDQAQQAIDSHTQQLAGLEATLQRLSDEKTQLQIAISNDTVGQELQRLKDSLTRLEEAYQRKKAQADSYTQLARQINLADATTPEAFASNQTEAHKRISDLEGLQQKLIQERDQAKQQETTLTEQVQTLQDEIASLSQRTSNLRAEDLHIRDRIAKNLGIATDELPFIGELLRVRQSEQAWEGAIERLLNGYGRTLLVPDTHYQDVKRFVDATNLHGRLVYFRAHLNRQLRGNEPDNSDALFSKLDIKPETPFSAWLRADLIERWNYSCCTSLEQFQREKRALTQQGQIKNGDRHEKDDRHRLNDRTRYVLGWDNREKIQALKQELEAHKQELQACHKQIREIEQKQRQYRDWTENLRTLLRFTSFAELDWQTEASQIATTNATIKELEASSDQLAKLQDRLRTVDEEHKRNDTERISRHSSIKTLENDISQGQKLMHNYQTLLAGADQAQLANSAPVIADASKDKEPPQTIHDVPEHQRRVEDTFVNRLQQYNGRLNGLIRDIQRQMLEFKHAHHEDTSTLDADMAAIPAYRALHERLVNDDLPSYQERFKQWLNGTILDAIVGFKSTLQKTVTGYRQSIDTLNEALQAIDYTPSTFIQLTASPTSDPEIRDFQVALSACIPDVGARTPDANEQSFQRIHALIQRFENDEAWTKRVTDCRNWLTFAANELYREDGTLKEFYSDSSGKSGGQKAKLAYTILASAIAHQYNLTNNDGRQQRNLRFVVVDEAFSKSDETNARYAMSLFQQLGLQLLVVTPLDKTHVVEPFISACHYVTNTPQENDSSVITLSIEEYLAQKAQFAAQARTSP